MTAENRKPIGSITEAMLIAKRANGIIPIAPCVKGTSAGQVKICPNVDKIKLCNDPDGILTDGKTFQCPKQRGVLTLIDTSALGENGSKGTSQKSRV